MKNAKEGNIVKNLLLIIILLVAGCASQRFASDPKEVAAYLSTETDRPDKIKTSLSKGELELGMSEKEVLLCWGKPDRVETHHSEKGVEKKWGYTDISIDGGIGRLSTWKIAVIREAVFNNGKLDKWKVIESDL